MRPGGGLPIVELQFDMYVVVLIILILIVTNSMLLIFSTRQ